MENTTNVHESTVATQNVGVLASLGINGQMFVFQLINFAIVILVLWFLILKPLSKKLEERKKLIDESLDKAKEAETNLAMSGQKYKEKMDEAKKEANKIIENADAEAGKLGEDMKFKAKEEIKALVGQAKKNLQVEKEKMSAELKKETGELVVLAVEKILSEKLDEKKDRVMIDDVIASL